MPTPVASPVKMSSPQKEHSPSPHRRKNMHSPLRDSVKSVSLVVIALLLLGAWPLLFYLSSSRVLGSSDGNIIKDLLVDTPPSSPSNNNDIASDYPINDDGDTSLLSSLVRRHHRQNPTTFQNTKYFQVAEAIKDITDAQEGPERYNSHSAYNRAVVVKKAPWLPHRIMCRETCCVESVAISLEQDARQLINTNDNLELSDIMIQHYDHEAHLAWHAENFNEQMLPCLVPGTIITIETHWDAIKYFVSVVRPKIKVPYVLITAGSDADSPYGFPEHLADPLLIKWYGTNPLYPTDLPQEVLQKFVPFPLGLSWQHPQERYLLPYMHFTNFTNPFQNKDRWLSKPRLSNFDDEVFVHFRFHDRPAYREHLWKVLCPTVTNATSSCNVETNDLPVTQIYADMSQYRFGISPQGTGWDCYRTYELLLLGVIPVIDERAPEGRDLYEGLPVIHMPNMNEATSRQDFIMEIEAYVASDEFRKTAVTDEAWEKLFLRYWRRKILHDTGRDREILTDPATGKKYYQGYKYSPGNFGNPILCHREGSCNPDENNLHNFEWLKGDPAPELSGDDAHFVHKWKRKGKIAEK